MSRFLCTLIVVGMLISCMPSPIRNTLPHPESVCAAELNWQGLVPGRSTQQDVVKALGNPTSTGSARFDDRQFSFYTYAVEGGRVSKYVSDRIFFEQDGVIDWIEVVVADRDGQFHPAQEILGELGNTIDTAYLNSSYNPSASIPHDVLAGPDELYIWSACGLALDIHNFCFPAQDGKLRCITPESGTNLGRGITTAVTLRNPNPRPFLDDAVYGSEHAILMKFLFRPTTYQGFLDYYIVKIPYGIWWEYLRNVEYQP
jgi:hypothetical protein